MKKSILKPIGLLSIVALLLTLYNLSFYKQTEVAHGGRPPGIDLLSDGGTEVAHGGRPPGIDLLSDGGTEVAHGGRPPGIDLLKLPHNTIA